MRAQLIAAIVSLVPLTAGDGFAARLQYVSVAFHDVVDQHTGAGDSVTTDHLIAFFEWLRDNGCTAITLDDIERAGSGARPLPDRAVLITFDDGYASLYTRVYPLLLAYKIPVVAALVGSWMEGSVPETMRVGDDLIPGTNTLITWDEAREMARSGLVEFASHTYDLHRSQLVNPQGGEEPAAITLAWDASNGYETETSYRRRIRTDLEKSSDLLRKELGRAPRAIAWPYGRYTQAAQEEAQAAKYEFLLTLDPEPGFADDLPKVARMYPTGDPDLRSMIVRLGADQPTAVRVMHLNPGVLWAAGPERFEKSLGSAIERVRALGATAVVVDAAIRGTSGRLEGVWFPNRMLPMKADLLSRIVWQMRTRARVSVAVSLPVSAARATVGDDDGVMRLFEDLGYSALADALLLDPAPALAAVPAEDFSNRSPWEVRRKRSSLDISAIPAADALALRAFFAFERVRQESRLFLLAQSIGASPSGVADLTLVEGPLAAKPFSQLVDRLAAAGWLAPTHRYSSGIWIQGEKPPSAAALSTDVRLFERRGGIAFGWEQDDPVADEPKADRAAPAVSSAQFPLRF
jgi:poly-beta-1,6-N-acetyl-D-glucosamine N-deacetylase